MQGLPGLSIRNRIQLAGEFGPRFPVVAAVQTDRFDAADPVPYWPFG